MSSKSRRKFLSQLGLTVGGLAIGKGIAKGFPPTIIQEKIVKQPRMAPAPRRSKDVVDFRYSPKNWQSTYCFPDDPYKSLVGKNGELLYGHPGTTGEINDFAEIVSIGIKGENAGTYLHQEMETAGIPIIRTKIGWHFVEVHLTSFATNDAEEGRVDNLIVEIFPKEKTDFECTPEVVVNSKKEFWHKPDDDKGEVRFDSATGAVLFVVDSSVTLGGTAPLRRYELKSGKATADKPLRYVLRFPQAGQPADKVKDRLGDAQELLEQARAYWQAWKPTDGKVGWNLPDEYGSFHTASVRNMVEAREIREGKRIFQVGPTVYRGSWLIDSTFMLEAARYAGYDKEAQEGLQTIWDRQKADGSFSGGAGEAHWKDTAAAIYMLIRQAELTQDWTYFNELYPDAMRGMKYLVSLRNNGVNEKTSNAAYGLLPRGFGDSGIGGIRSEFTNTAWTLIMLRAFLELADKLVLQRASEVREFYTELRQAFFEAAKAELRKDPRGFSYLPMLMKEDPKWSEKDERKQPRPQAAQIYMSHLIYPGQVFPKDFYLVKGHIELMKAITKEEIPCETGWLPDNAVWAYNAPIVSQVYLYAGETDLARKTFIGFLNHASPLHAWREEQSLIDAPITQYIGDMPHNWASAECIRYLRHMLILEELDRLRLLDGIGLDDLLPRKPFALEYSPTRWGRVSIALEPLDLKTWQVRYKREAFHPRIQFELKPVELPRRLPGNFQFDKIVGVERPIKNGPRVYLDPNVNEWTATFKNFERP